MSTESGRYHARKHIADYLDTWFAQRTFASSTSALTECGAAWGPYQTFDQLLDDPRMSGANSLFDFVEQPGIGTFPVPASPLNFGELSRLPAQRAPVLGEHTDEILSDILGLNEREIGRLHDADVVASGNP
ncbi:hypothetical protein GCM10020255_000670 [Rhodococcus baikonurensis]